jgi:subtilisin family serine protease
MLTRFTHLRLAFMILAILAGTSLLLNYVRTSSASASLTSVIIELRDDPGAVYKAKVEKSGGKVTDDQLQAYRDQLSASQDQFLNDLKSRGVSYQVDGVDIKDFSGATAAHADFRYTLVLNGITLSVPPSAVSVIQSMPQVKRVQPNANLKINLEKSVDYVNAPAAYGPSQELTAEDDDRDGYEGQGINVAVLDTGIDWTHEMFGGDHTPPRLGVAPPNAALNSNKKVIYYLSFTGGLIDDFGHGTAASSNIAGYLGFAPGADKLPGTADDIRLHGVAPQARLMGYKVCLGVGSCLSASTIKAIEDAVSPRTLTLQPKPVADVINLSLGGPGGPDDSTAVAASNAALLGTTVVASAGNEGPGEGTVGSPAAGRHVIAVGANNDPASGSNTVDHIGGRTGLIANKLEGSAPITADITQNYVFCGWAETPDQVPDSVRGKIALIARGGSVSIDEPVAAGTGLFSNKAAFAFAKGAIAVVIYNNEDAELSAATVRASAIPVVGISRDSGRYLKSQMLPGANPNPDLKNEPADPPFGTVSAGKIRLNSALFFQPQMTDFSSRGPVQGLGQVKPDVTAPGLAILSATVRVGSADTNTGTMFDPSGYIPASGTSFSGPHVAGAVALIKQAHQAFTPDMIRAVLTNTSTNLRSASGTPRADGNASEPIIAQGGGLINVAAAINAKALMGVTGDGIVEPSILANHSFGEMPILNNRVANTRSVTVTIRDTSGQGGTYNLSTANNRFFDLDGVTATVSPSSVTVPANGSVTFTASVTLDGDKVRDDAKPKQLQWYVVAKRADNTETLRMPMYLRANPSEPAGEAAGSTTETFTGLVPAGDAGAQRDFLGYFPEAEGVTYADVKFNVTTATIRVDATLDYASTEIGDVPGFGMVGTPDLDFYLLDPAGNEIDSSAGGNGAEHINVPVRGAGTYTYRVMGFANAATNFTITSNQLLGAAPPAVSPLAGEFTDAQNKAVDFDGSYTLQWQPATNALKYEVEESTDGTNYSLIRTVDSNTTSISFENVPNGTRSYRVRSVTPGQIGFYVTAPSSAQSILVDHRGQVTLLPTEFERITRDASLSFTGGVMKFDLGLRNKYSTALVPIIEFQILSIITSTGSNNNISARNADNGGDGKSAQSRAIYRYSSLLGSDQLWSIGEVTGNRTLEFNNATGEPFSLDVLVTGFQNGATGGGAAGGGEAAQSTSSGGGSGSPTTTLSLPVPNTLLRITINPLTKTITSRVISR